MQKESGREQRRQMKGFNVSFFVNDRSMTNPFLVAACMIAILLPATVRADAAPLAADQVETVETAGNLEDMIAGSPIPPDQGARGEDLGKWSNYAEPGELASVGYSQESESPNLDRTKRFFLSVGSTLGSIVYFPVKLVVGVAGAWVGGVAGAVSGGDQATASGIWNVTTDGDYFVSPEELDGTTEFRFTGDHR